MSASILDALFLGGIVPFMPGGDQSAKHRDPAYRKALFTSALLNLAMLFIEGGASLAVGSAALLADAVDFLEDSAVLTLALVAIRWSVRARAGAGFIQGSAMAGVGIGAVAQIVHRLREGGAPPAAPISGVAALALAVNGYCAYRLIRFRGGDASMRALWLSLRNDALLNVLTIVAGGFIALTGSGWPDIIAGAIIASVNLWAAVEVLRAATAELR